MTTLQALLTHTAKVAKTAVATDAAPENTATGDSLPSHFITELGNQLLALAKQQGKLQPGETRSAEEAAGKDDKTSLSTLLQALDKPDALNALFQPAGSKAGLKSADDSDEPAVTPLSASDLQNVQALFAMLPAMVENRPPLASGAQPPVAANATAGTPLNAALTGALLTGTAQATEQADAAVPHTGSQDAPALTARADALAASSHSSTAPASSGALTLDESFRQMLGGLSKSDERHALSAGQEQPAAHLSTLFSSSAPVNTASASLQGTPSTPMLNAQLGSQEWQQALGQQIVMFSRNGQQNAELRLHPEDLGALQISLTMDKDQAQLTLVSGHSHVRAALEAALPQLRSALAESGINLGQSQVSSDAFAQSQQQHAGQQENQRDGQYGRFTQALESDSEITPVAVPATLQARAAGSGGVDIFA